MAAGQRTTAGWVDQAAMGVRLAWSHLIRLRLTNVTISANVTGTSARGTDGGNGGGGGEGSTGGNGGDAGSGSDAGYSGSGAGISMPSGSPAFAMYFNTIVLNSISIPIRRWWLFRQPGYRRRGRDGWILWQRWCLSRIWIRWRDLQVLRVSHIVSHDPGRQSGRYELYELLQCLHESISIWGLEPDRGCSADVPDHIWRRG